MNVPRRIASKKVQALYKQRTKSEINSKSMAHMMHMMYSFIAGPFLIMSDGNIYFLSCVCKVMGCPV